MTTITHPSEATRNRLQNLVDINVDSAKGFETAADNIGNKEIASMFRSDASRRRLLADDLRVHLPAGEQTSDGTFKGRMHRWWIDLRGTVQDGDEYAILAEAERGEDAIKEMYEEAIGEEPEGPIRDLLRQHLRAVTDTHDRIRDMRNAPEVVGRVRNDFSSPFSRKDPPTMNRSNTALAEHSALQDDIHALRQDLAMLRDDAVKTAKDGVGVTIDQARKLADEVGSAKDKVGTQVAENPWSSLLIAAGFGAIASRFILRK